MAKINFNTPFLNENGEPILKAKLDGKKVKQAPDGRMIPIALTNEDGTVAQEPIHIKDMLHSILMAPFEGDDKVPFGERAKRGKLARKIVTSSTANYRTEELTTIQELTAKIGSTALVSQLDDLINGVEEKTANPTETDGKEKAA